MRDILRVTFLAGGDFHAFSRILPAVPEKMRFTTHSLTKRLEKKVGIKVVPTKTHPLLFL